MEYLGTPRYSYDSAFLVETKFNAVRQKHGSSGALMQPLPLTEEERTYVRDYLKCYASFAALHYDDDPFDGFKIAEYRCLCYHYRQELQRLYARVPDVVKTEALVPLPPPPPPP